MADGGFTEGSSSSQVDGESLEATVEINIKTLDSKIYSFRVDKNMPVPSLKEKIASTVGVPVGQQRLIFRGKVLKDDHLLSEYHVEDGHTLHLVARQPVQPQSQSGTSSDETRSNGNQGNDGTGSAPRARIGHGVVLGLNVSDPGEGTAADLSRIIGSVLNSFGIAPNIGVVGNAGSGSTSVALNTRSQASQSVETGSRGDIGNQSTQTPLHGSLLHHMVIPDSLTTISAFINRMEQAMSGYQSPSPSNSEERRQSDVPPSIPLGYPSPDALITVLERVQRLLSGPAAATLLHISGRLERERASTELSVRGQIQTEAMHIGVTMQHLGSLFLELGRTISTLRMGESPAESMVNAGPAVYISASGPNPIMVQPTPHQVSPIFGVPSLSPLVNLGVPEALGVVDAPRNINIHVHAGTTAASGAVPIASRINAGQASRGQPVNQGLPFPNLQQASGDRHSGPMAGNGARSPEQVAITQLPSDSIPGIVAQINAHLASLSGSAQRQQSSNPNLQSAGPSDLSADASQLPKNKATDEAGESSSDSAVLHGSDTTVSGIEQKNHTNDIEACSSGSGDRSVGEQASSTSLLRDSGSLSRNSGKAAVDSSVHSTGPSKSKDSGTSVPLGLGLGGLQPKRRKQQTTQGKNAVSFDRSNSGAKQQLIAKGQEVLQSLVSQSSNSKPSDKAVLSLPQTPNDGLGSPAASRSTPQVGNHNQNLGGMLSGMLRQMMPVVSQAFGMGPSRTSPSSPHETGLQPLHNGSSRDNILDGRYPQTDLCLAVERIEHLDSPENIFRGVLEAAGQLYGTSLTNLAEVLSSDEELTNEFMEMMRQDICRRLQSQQKP